MDMTPDELRKLADLLERPTKDGARLARAGMRAAADAWEADRKRLEAAENELDIYKSCIGPVDGMIAAHEVAKLYPMKTDIPGDRGIGCMGKEMP